MGAKKKGGKKKKGAREEAEPLDEYTKMDGATLERTMASLKERLAEAKVKRNLIQIEKDMIHDFYHNTRNEIKETEAEIKNFDSEMQKMEDAHRAEIKVYIQKVKHIEYEHQLNCQNIAGEAGTAQASMADQHKYHEQLQKDMRGDKKAQKEDYERDELQNIGEVDDKEKELQQNMKDLQLSLETSKKALIENYEQKLDNLREELELRLKVEVHEIEERKNQHINDLMKNHQEAFKEMKEYYNDITKENLELIKMHKEKLVDIRAQIEANQKTVDHLKLKMEELKVPLANCLQDRDNLKKCLATFDKDVMALRNAKARLEVLKESVRQIKDQRKELEEKFLKVEKEKQDMYKKFEIAIDQLKSRSDYKNQILDEKLRVLQSELERKEVQL